MGDRWWGESRWRVAAAALLVVPLFLAACGGDGDATSAPTTTIDPFAEPVVDACGNDLSALTSTVWGVDPGTGEVRWQTPVPLADSYLLRDTTGNPRVSLVLRSVEAVLDIDTGAVVATPDAGVHEVLVDVAGATASGVGGLIVDGEAQPATVEVDGLSVSTARGEVGQTTIALTAVDPATVAPAWNVVLGAADQIGSLSPPVAYGETVVVVTSPPRPICP